MGKRLYIETFGCQMNVNDSEKIRSLLAPLGYGEASSPEDADLVILNTCSVRAKAEDRVYAHLATYRGLKRANRSLLLGVGGCVAQQEGERLLQRVPHLDFVFGTHTLHRIPEIVADAESGRRRVWVDILDPDERRDLFPMVTADGGVTRFVTIMQGCDNFCSYCVVPHVRGREVSRRSADILEEIRRLVDGGAREVTLLGQNVNSYGRKEPGELSFAALLRKVAAIDGVRRIRFTTSHPKDVSDELISCFAEIPALCSHFHLPLQAGSDRILSLMKRGYTLDRYLSLVERLRAVRPDISLSSDIIVGFPGETEDEFLETVDAIERIRYGDIFSFMYSPRPFTEAAALPETLTRAEKQRRLDHLQRVQREITLQENRRLVGTVQEILIEGNSRKGGQLSGRTSSNRVVNVAAPERLMGEFVMVRIIEARQTSVIGELIDQPGG
ncbi:MAG: tRNA (N6-isopentenyl adenosine(37)-C2)-methylthiotransferase MiaB [Desulfuromonadia bacterium]